MGLTTQWNFMSHIVANGRVGFIEIWRKYKIPKRHLMGKVKRGRLQNLQAQGLTVAEMLIRLLKSKTDWPRTFPNLNNKLLHYDSIRHQTSPYLHSDTLMPGVTGNYAFMLTPASLHNSCSVWRNELDPLRDSTTESPWTFTTPMSLFSLCPVRITKRR